MLASPSGRDTEQDISANGTSHYMRVIVTDIAEDLAIALSRYSIGGVDMTRQAISRTGYFQRFRCIFTDTWFGTAAEAACSMPRCGGILMLGACGPQAQQDDEKAETGHGHEGFSSRILPCGKKHAPNWRYSLRLRQQVVAVCHCPRFRQSAAAEVNIEY